MSKHGTNNNSNNKNKNIHKKKKNDKKYRDDRQCQHVRVSEDAVVKRVNEQRRISLGEKWKTS